MGSISSKSLKKEKNKKEKKDELDVLLEEDNLVEEELDELEDEKDEEEVYVPKSIKKRMQIQKEKVSDKIYVTLNEAATYVLDGKVYKRHEVVEEPRSKLSKFKNNGWFSVRY